MSVRFGIGLALLGSGADQLDEMVEQGRDVVGTGAGLRVALESERRSLEKNGLHGRLVASAGRDRVMVEAA